MRCCRLLRRRKHQARPRSSGVKGPAGPARPRRRMRGATSLLPQCLMPLLPAPLRQLWTMRHLRAQRIAKRFSAAACQMLMMGQTSQARASSPASQLRSACPSLNHPHSCPTRQRKRCSRCHLLLPLLPAARLRRAARTSLMLRDQLHPLPQLRRSQALGALLTLAQQQGPQRSWMRRGQPSSAR